MAVDRQRARGQLVALLREYSEDVPDEDPLAPKRVNGPQDPVSGGQLGAVLQMLEVRHQGLIQLMEQKFRSLEDLSRERWRQQDESKDEVKMALDKEIQRNDKRFTLVVGTVIVTIMAEAVKLLFFK